MAVLRADIEAALEHVTRPFLVWLTGVHAALGGRTEIRILRDGVVWSTLISPEDVNALVAALVPAAASPRETIPRGDHPRSGEANVYFSLGAVAPEAGLFTGLPLRRTRRTARDIQIVGSPWFVVDVDPLREPKGRSATDTEKAAARAVAEAVQAELAARGVVTALADSGNGWHLLARPWAATGDQVRGHAERCKALLRALDGLHSTEVAVVDRSVFNPGRIFKLYGTVAVKGKDLPEAPHRLSHIDVAAIPAEGEVFALLKDLLPAPAATKAVEAAHRPPTRGRGGDNEAWRAWRHEALARLDLGLIYGDLLTGKQRAGWLECRDPASPSGDRSPSAGVADGLGQAERGTFKSFRRDTTSSVFDFLVEQGRASDFISACRLVAEMTGCELPPLARLSEEAPPEDFAAAWASAADAQAREKLLRAAVVRTLDLGAIERFAALERLREESGLTRRVFAQVISEARAERQRALRAAPTSANRSETVLPVVEYVENVDKVEDLAARLLNLLIPTRRFFHYEHGVVHVERGRGVVVLNERSFPGFLTAHLEVAIVQDWGEGPVHRGYAPLPHGLASAMVHSPRFRARLPRLTAYARSPVFDLEWNFVGTFGWHEASGIFYDGAEVRPRKGDQALRAALDGFAWKEEADRVNVIGALLTMLSIPQWTRGHPFLAINGNKSGVGKSTLAQVLAVIIEGRLPATVTYVPREEELEKRIATQVESGDRVVIIDNARTSAAIASTVLERSVTDARPSFRRLGTNTTISRPVNDLLFVLTMNMTQLGADLRRRALPLNLEVAGNVRQRHYVSVDPVGEALAARGAILGELAWMIRAWLRARSPMPPDPPAHSTGQRWAATIDAILRHAGLEGFLSNFEASSHAYDADYEAVRDVAAAHHAEPVRTASEWAALLVSGALSDRLRDPRGLPKPPRAQATIVGHLFSQYLDVVFDVAAGEFRLRQWIPRKGHPPVYCFEAVR